MVNFNHMSEKNFGGEKQLNKFENYYLWLLNRFPEGHLGAENAIPITIDGNKMELIIFGQDADYFSFGLFLPNRKYARKTLLIHEMGFISEDTRGVIPEFDDAEDEPKFTSSNEQIITAVMETIKKQFPDN